jgi:hypothetical protein
MSRRKIVRVFGSLITIASLVAILGVFPNTAFAQQCKTKASIDYYGEWGPYYNACYSEMRTTFEYNRGMDGSPLVWCQVDNTSYSEIYDAGQVDGNPIVRGTHCESSLNHRLLIDVQPTIGQYGFISPMKLTADYFEDTPQ